MKRSSVCFGGARPLRGSTPRRQKIWRAEASVASAQKVQPSGVSTPGIASDRLTRLQATPGPESMWSASDEDAVIDPRVCVGSPAMTTLDLAAVRYADEDDRPHEPGAGPDWQESYVFAWWDDDAGIGGFFRTGHETGRDTGSALVGLVTADGLRYRRNLENLALNGEDRAVGLFGVADGAYVVRFG